MYEDRKKLVDSLLYPSIFLILIWLVKIVEVSMKLDFSSYGLYPLKFKGLLGILTCPFIHGDFKHLISNSVPVFILSAGIFYFYKEVAFRVIVLSYLLTGIWVWLMARESYHIGASGLVYAFASFLFFSGIIRKNRSLLAISMLVTFLYGGMVWGIFPHKREISWESHLMGFIAGIVLAFNYKQYGPQLKKFEWEDEEDDENSDNEPLTDIDFQSEISETKPKENAETKPDENQTKPLEINYIYTEKPLI